MEAKHVSLGVGCLAFLHFSFLVNRLEREEIYPGDFSPSGDMHWLLPSNIDNQHAHKLAQ